jgi:hypothetical protein
MGLSEYYPNNAEEFERIARRQRNCQRSKEIAAVVCYVKSIRVRLKMARSLRGLHFERQQAWGL